MRAARLWSILLVACASLSLDCASLDPLAGGTCGNGVVEAGEDCDSFSPSQFARGVCGGAGEGASACRLKCATTSDCPDGWGCSLANVCRAASGEFTEPGDAMSAGLESLAVGDFDGDRRKDLLGLGPRGADNASKVRVHYFGDGASLAGVAPLSAPITSPVIRDFNEDGRDDMAFGLGFFGAFGVMNGQADRTLVPAVFPSFRLRAEAKPVLAFRHRRMLPNGRSSEFFFAGRLVTRDNRPINALATFEGGYVHPLPVGADGIVGTPLWAPLLFGDVTSTCGEIAIAMRGAGLNAVEVFSPCRTKPGDDPSFDAQDRVGQWNDTRAPIVVDIPAPLEGGIFVVDFDHDSRLDILVGTRSGPDAAPVVYLLRANGTGFDAPRQTALNEVPLAAGALDSDALIDFVVPSGLALSSLGDNGFVDAGPDAAPDVIRDGTQKYTVVAVGRRRTWTTARIGQLNGDRFPDVVAAADDEPDIDFLNGTENGFVLSTIATLGPVLKVTTADFDGDRVTDVAFLSRTSATSRVVDVAVAYGRSAGPPEPPRSAGRADDVVDLDPFESLGGPVPGIGLFIRGPTSTPDEVPELAFALVTGNGDRQPLAPLILVDQRSTSPSRLPGIDREWVPFDLAAAAMEDKGRVDVVAFALGLPVRGGAILPPPWPSEVWVARSRGKQGFDTPMGVARVADLAFGSDPSFTYRVRTAAGDLDAAPDGRDELVVLSSAAGGATRGLELRIARMEARAPQVVAFLEGEHLPSFATMALVDVDGDGSRDAVAVIGTDAESKVAVFYNDGRGGLVSPPAIVAVPSQDGDVAVRGFARIVTAGAPAHEPGSAQYELALVTDKRVLFASPRREDRSQFDVRVVVGGAGDALSGGSGLAAGDFDGDGVDDLALVDGGTIRIMRQLPRR